METRVSLWAAKDENSCTVWLYASRPELNLDGNAYSSSIKDMRGNVDERLFPNLTFDNSPVEVELTVKIKE